MAEKADDPCQCTHPELPQFVDIPKVYPTASKGKSLVLESLVLVSL